MSPKHMPPSERALPQTITITDLPEFANPGGRDEGLFVRLVAHSGMGANDYVAVHTIFPPGAGHEIHRHPDADQLVTILSGSLIRTTVGAKQQTVVAGDVLHVPAGAWHGLRNDTAETATALAFFGGIGDGRAAGFESYGTETR
jgi:quercetin dioxygenase-like cupin family protein